MNRNRIVCRAVFLVAVTAFSVNALNTKRIGLGNSGAEGLCIAEAQGNGAIRLYTVDGWNHSGRGMEWTYHNGAWVSAALFTGGDISYSPVPAAPLSGQAGILFGTYPTETIMRAVFDGSWKVSALPISLQGKVLCLVTAEGQNDGVTRLYVATGDQSGGKLRELSLSGHAWTEETIMTGDVGRFGVGHGRNDGLTRMYTGSRSSPDGVLELTWNGSVYSASVIKPGIRVQTAYVGDGRGDGVNRVYINQWNGPLYEFTWNGGGWDEITVTGNASRFYLASGKLRSDGKNRLYASQQGFGVREFGWNGSSFDGLDGLTGATGQMALGNGRGDGKSRLYVAGGEHSGIGASLVEVSDPNPPDAATDATRPR